jgi:hypothetical protein
VLDQALLQRLMAQTQEVSIMLGEAMREQELEEETETQQTVSAETGLDPRFENLDARFHAMLSQLLARPTWGKREFDALARELKLMPDGALDAVNSWSYERYDDPLIEELGEELHVHAHLIESRP